MSRRPLFRLPRAAAPAVALLLALPLASCGSDGGGATGGPGTTPAAESFEPVTVEHAFGTTETVSYTHLTLPTKRIV